MGAKTASEASFKTSAAPPREHPFDAVGERLRATMPWIAEIRLVARAKN